MNSFILGNMVVDETWNVVANRNLPRTQRSGAQRDRELQLDKHDGDRRYWKRQKTAKLPIQGYRRVTEHGTVSIMPSRQEVCEALEEVAINPDKIENIFLFYEHRYYLVEFQDNDTFIDAMSKRISFREGSTPTSHSFCEVDEDNLLRRYWVGAFPAEFSTERLAEAITRRHHLASPNSKTPKIMNIWRTKTQAITLKSGRKLKPMLDGRVGIDVLIPKGEVMPRILWVQTPSGGFEAFDTIRDGRHKERLPKVDMRAEPPVWLTAAGDQVTPNSPKVTTTTIEPSPSDVVITTNKPAAKFDLTDLEKMVKEARKERNETETQQLQELDVSLEEGEIPATPAIPATSATPATTAIPATPATPATPVTTEVQPAEDARTEASSSKTNGTETSSNKASSIKTASSTEANNTVASSTGVRTTEESHAVTPVMQPVEQTVTPKKGKAKRGPEVLSPVESAAKKAKDSTAAPGVSATRRKTVAVLGDSHALLIGSMLSDKCANQVHVMQEGVTGLRTDHLATKMNCPCRFQSGSCLCPKPKGDQKLVHFPKHLWEGQKEVLVVIGSNDLESTAREHGDNVKQGAVRLADSIVGTMATIWNRTNSNGSRLRWMQIPAKRPGSKEFEKTERLRKMTNQIVEETRNELFEVVKLIHPEAEHYTFKNGIDVTHLRKNGAAMQKIIEQVLA